MMGFFIVHYYVVGEESPVVGRGCPGFAAGLRRLRRRFFVGSSPVPPSAGALAATGFGSCVAGFVAAGFFRSGTGLLPRFRSCLCFGRATRLKSLTNSSSSAHSVGILFLMYASMASR